MRAIFWRLIRKFPLIKALGRSRWRNRLIVRNFKEDAGSFFLAVRIIEFFGPLFKLW